MSRKKPVEPAPDFRKGDPDGEGMRRVVVNTIANAPAADITEMLTSAHHGRKLQATQQKKSKGPRGATDDGRTIADVVRSLATPDTDPADIWPRMHDALTGWCGDEPKLETDAKGRPFYSYELIREGKTTLKKRLKYKRFTELLKPIK